MQSREGRRPEPIAGSGERRHKKGEAALVSDHTSPASSDLLRIAYAPNGFVSIVCDHERPILRDSNAHWPTPDASLRSYKPGQKIFIFSACFSILERHPDYFIAGPGSLVPGTVLGCENIAVVLLRKL